MKFGKNRTVRIRSSGCTDIHTYRALVDPQKKDLDPDPDPNL